MIAIKINGIEHKNVASITPTHEYDFYHSVKTLDGKLHRETKGRRTNFYVIFYNGNFAEYDDLKALLLSAETITLEAPIGAEGKIVGEYYVTVNNDNLKGLMYNGKYYSTGLSVTFERVGFDE